MKEKRILEDSIRDLMERIKGIGMVDKSSIESTLDTISKVKKLLVK